MAKLKIKPIGPQVLVKPDEAPPRENDLGLRRPDQIEQEKKAVGTVVSCGKSINHLVAGHRVIYGVYAGETINFEGIDYKLLFADPDSRDNEILAIIE